MNRLSRLGCRGITITRKLLFGFFFTILTTIDTELIRPYIVYYNIYIEINVKSIY